MSPAGEREAVDARPSAPAETAFGRYRLLHRLASGGMGSVFLARASGPAGFEKLVALKRIHEHMASDRRFVSMFLDEARIAARIQHPNVCSVIDFGEIDGAYYLTMPYIFGEPLHRVIAAAAIRQDAVADALPFMITRLVQDACEGLHAAHELRDEEGRRLNVVHRDISPHNLMVGYDGVVRVLDFGVASAEHRHYQTATGEVKGKLAYCSPEQIEARDLDRRSDVWSLGVVLWEGISGRRLFGRANMMATVRAISDMEIPDLRQAAPQISEELAAVAEKALAPKPEGRFTTAREMGRALQVASARAEQFVSAADVADWMNELFPDGRERKQELIERTTTGSLPLAEAGASGLVSPPQGAPQASPRPARQPVLGPRRLAWLALALLVPMGIASGMAIIFALASADRNPSGDEPEVASAPEEGATPPAPTPPAEARGGEPSPVAVAAGDPAADDAERADMTFESPPAPEELPAPEEASAPEELPAPEEPAPEEPAATPPSTGRVPAPTAGRRSRPALAQAPGNLNVATPGGWGIVYHRGRRLGEAPGVFSMPAGATVIEVEPRGQRPRIRRRVRVPSGGTVRVSIPMP